MREQIINNIQKSLAHPSGLPTLPLAPIPPLLLETDRDTMIAAFKDELTKLGGTFAATRNGVEWTLNFLRERNIKRVLTWDEKFLPVKGLHDALKRDGVEILDHAIASGDRATRATTASQVAVGITGVEAAIADVGGLVLSHKAGRGRLTSLIAPTHIAFIKRDQFYPTLESWWSRFDSSLSNTVVIVGPSRTSDIERVLVLGAHGPKEVITVFLE